MAAVTNHSPRRSAGGDASAALSSPKPKRGAAARGVAFPWTQVVLGAESEAIVSSSVPPAAAAAAVVAPPSPSASAPSQGPVGNSSSPDWSPTKAASATSSTSSFSSSPDDSAAGSQPESHNNVNAAKKPAWKKPSNGALEVGPVMGAVSWPALSESTRASPKSSSSDSLKALSDGSILVSQGTGIASSTSQKQVITNNTSPGSTPNHATPTKSMKRGSGSSSVSANGGFPQPPLAPAAAGEMPYNNNSGKPGPSVPESSSGDHTHKDGGPRGGFGSQSHGGNNHPPHRNSFRRGNGGPHPRGDGSYHHSYGGRRDQDRGSHDWNSHRSFNGRDAHMQPPRGVPRNFIRPPSPSSAQFIPHPPVPVRPFGNPMVYPEMASPVIYVPAPPIVAPMPPHAMFFPVMDPQLHARIVNQIDYYFSNENLIKDTFLRQNMDEEGWVQIKLIAGFKKVMILTDNIQLILDAVRTSNVLEVQGDKVRRRNDWKRWIMPPSVQFPNVSGPQSIGRSSHDMLPTNIQSLSLEEETNKQGQAEASSSRSLSGDFNSHSQRSSGVGTGQISVEAGSERAISARSSSK